MQFLSENRALIDGRACGAVIFAGFGYMRDIPDSMKHIWCGECGMK